MYNRILNGAKDWQSRLTWLRQDTSGATQPYRQLAEVLDNSGDTEGATQVRERHQGELSVGNDKLIRVFE